MTDPINVNVIFSVLVSVILAGVSWWVKNIWSMVIEQQKLIAELQVELARNYVPRIELQQVFDRIFAKLDEILEREVSRKSKEKS